jgi:hypothetical protein
MDLQFKIGGLDNDDRISIYAYHNSVPVPIGITNINLGGNITYTADGLFSTAPAGNAPANSVRIDVGSNVDEIVILSGKTAGSPNYSNTNTLQIYELRYCTSLDSDGDGVPDSYDLDSDNDGIYDVVEAGSGQPFTNGVLNGPVTAQGIPTAVDADANGVVDYTIKDSDSDGNIDSVELDSDNDGCPDVIEAGFVDHNGDGLLGNTPLTTDPTNGLVTSTAF